jgi:hypothetical protein
MCQVLGKIHRIHGPLDRLIRIAEQPTRPCPNVSTTDPRVVATVDKSVRVVLLAIVKSHALLGVVTTGGEHVRHPKARSPGGVMSLQEELRIRPLFGNGQQFVGQPSRLLHLRSRPMRVKVPQVPRSGEQLRVSTSVVAEFPCTSVGLADLCCSGTLHRR